MLGDDEDETLLTADELMDDAISAIAEGIRISTKPPRGGRAGDAEAPHRFRLLRAELLWKYGKRAAEAKEELDWLLRSKRQERKLRLSFHLFQHTTIGYSWVQVRATGSPR